MYCLALNDMKPGRAILVLLALMPSIGCAAKPELAPVGPLDAGVWKSPHAERVEHVGSVAVAEGTPPLAYQVAEACTVRVMDARTSKEVARADAVAGQIVAVETTKGVTLAGKSLSAAQPADHLFTIFVDIRNPEAGPPAADEGKKK